MLKEPNTWLPPQTLPISRKNSAKTLVTGQKTFSYRGAKLYNSIAKDIRDNVNFNAFKKRIFKYLFNS